MIAPIISSFIIIFKVAKLLKVMRDNFIFLFFSFFVADTKLTVKLASFLVILPIFVN